MEEYSMTEPHEVLAGALKDDSLATGSGPVLGLADTCAGTQ